MQFRQELDRSNRIFVVHFYNTTEPNLMIFHRYNFIIRSIYYIKQQYQNVDSKKGTGYWVNIKEFSIVHKIDRKCPGR